MSARAHQRVIKGGLTKSHTKGGKRFFSSKEKFMTAQNYWSLKFFFTFTIFIENKWEESLWKIYFSNNSSIIVVQTITGSSEAQS